MMYVEKYAKEVTAFTKVTKHLADKMYVTGYGGNAAWKLALAGSDLDCRQQLLTLVKGF